MKVTVRYTGPLAVEAGCAGEDFTFSAAVPLSAVLAAVRHRHGAGSARLLWDARGTLQPFVRVAVDGVVVDPGGDPPLRDGSEIVVALAIGGG